MTDLQKMISTFRQIGVKFNIYKEKDSWLTNDIQYDKTICVDHGFGFPGSYVEFYFMEGKYLGHGVWE